jgi:hypothetical protein
MLVVYSKQAIEDRFGASDGAKVLQEVLNLGPTTMDVSGKGRDAIRAAIAQQQLLPSVPVCLIGGYRLIPTFDFPNPTRLKADEDTNVLSDAPYGGKTGSLAECYLPSRAVSRIPDSGDVDAGGFIEILRKARSAPGKVTHPETFEMAAEEFKGAAGFVTKTMPGQSQLRLSPPDKLGVPSLTQLIAKRGRVHILLHGAHRGDRRDALWGRGVADPELTLAVNASEFLDFDMDGSIVTFSTCYAATLEPVDNETARTPKNQVALACLTAGAKAVYGCTRANWIDTLAPFDSFGTALAAAIWTELRAGKPAAQALRDAKMAHATAALASPDGKVVPYVLKTLLQTHCYGNPLATLQ